MAIKCPTLLLANILCQIICIIIRVGTENCLCIARFVSGVNKEVITKSKGVKYYILISIYTLKKCI